MSFSIGTVLPLFFAISPKKYFQRDVFEPEICAFIYEGTNIDLNTAHIWALFKSIYLSCTDVVSDGDVDDDDDDDDIGVYGGADDGDDGGVDAVHSLLKVGRLKEDK